MDCLKTEYNIDGGIIMSKPNKRLAPRDVVLGESHYEVYNHFGDTPKSDLAMELVGPVYGVVQFGGYNTGYSKKILKRQIYRDALRDHAVLAKYSEFKSTLGLLSIFAWPIFKVILKWVVLFIIDRYLQEER